MTTGGVVWRAACSMAVIACVYSFSLFFFFFRSFQLHIPRYWLFLPIISPPLLSLSHGFVLPSPCATHLCALLILLLLLLLLLLLSKADAGNLWLAGRKIKHTDRRRPMEKRREKLCCACACVYVCMCLGRVDAGPWPAAALVLVLMLLLLWSRGCPLVGAG